MSWALKASIAIALQSRRGTWCHPTWIAATVKARTAVVAELCREMGQADELQVGSMPGGDLVFGVGIESDDAPLIAGPDAAEATA